MTSTAWHAAPFLSQSLTVLALSAAALIRTRPAVHQEHRS